jgi:hypothetical protein
VLIFFTSLYIYIQYIYRMIKSICAPDDYSTRLSCLTTCLNVTAWQPTARARGETRLILTPPVIHNSNYVIMVSDWNSLKYFCVFLYCNHVVHRLFNHPVYSVCLSWASMEHVVMRPKNSSHGSTLFHIAPETLCFPFQHTCLYGLVGSYNLWWRQESVDGVLRSYFS